MLAARDQENLAYSHQTAATAKPLNQGTRQTAPKTPGNKAPKIPFKLPLNDENLHGGFGGGKAGLKGTNKGNENALTAKKQGLGEKNAFATPLGPRTRAPLGLKTTNAKAKAFQTPAPILQKDEAKTNAKSVSARKAKPRLSHARMTKLEVLGDNDQLEERDIEYMPPKAKDLPDHPGDLDPLNPSTYDDADFLSGDINDFIDPIGSDGKRWSERQEEEQARVDERSLRKAEAAYLRDIDSAPVLCIHSPECPTNLCKITLENRKSAEKVYKETIASIEAEGLAPSKKPLKEKPALPTKSVHPKTSRTTPTSLTVKPSKSPAPSLKDRLNTSFAMRPKKPPPPTNPSSMRHNAAVATSRTTMGYSKGRAASAMLKQPAPSHRSEPRKTADRVPSLDITPAENISRFGERDDGKSLEELMGFDTTADLFKEQAEEEFVLTLNE